MYSERYVYNVEGESALRHVQFTAIPSVSRNFVTEYETVIFDEIRENFGGHFNTSSSAFTCPVSGMYLVFVAIHSANAQEASVRILVESNRKEGLRTDGTGGHASSSAMIVTHCQAGERITVRARNEFEDHYVYAKGSGIGYSMFTVLLVQADSL